MSKNSKYHGRQDYDAIVFENIDIKSSSFEKGTERAKDADHKR